ncbi:synaptotagmin-5-like [Mizuhopecten yessoensis]|uniref:Synaptotagmin-9 n=1 Tax=Mizuhopecten yessoensis TaxID=6573 RepID=A0A210QE06_MIZYE|nr:synaptotagmin-5-like [Mizuhopecten yessoensis]OWF46975.1 Synaptotagmin-9 [Mizuhopecten yessoensis]
MGVLSYVNIASGVNPENRTKDQGINVPEKNGNFLMNSNPDTENGLETSDIIVASSVAVVSCIIFIVTCTICFRRNRAIRRKLVTGQHIVEMDARSPFNIASVPNQTNETKSGKYVEPDKDFNENARIDVSEMSLDQPGYGTNVKPAVFRINECGPPSSLSSSEDSEKSRPPSSLSMNKPRKSLTACSITQSQVNLLKLESAGTADVMRRSCSMSNLDLSIDDRAFDGVVKTTFTVNYDEWNFTLAVNLHSVCNLPTKARTCYVFATVCLMPDDNEKRQTRTLPCVGDYVCFEEQYVFHNVRKRILENGTIRISFYRQKKGRKGKKDSLLGELFLKCSDVDMQCNIPTRFSKLEAPRKRLTRMSTSDKLLHNKLGDFFVDLQYQSLADRLKVFVRKAIQLPPTDRLMVVKSAHYVVVKLIRDGTVIEVQKTRTSSGRNAVWNEAFLFNVDKQMSSYSLEFLIMKGKLHKKDNVVGKVEIGPNCGRRGRDHWNSMISPRPIDVAKWHSILPVFAY